MKKICCFTGHREIENKRAEITSALRTLLPKLISDGVKIFRCGGAIGFDMIAAEEILRLKRNFSDIELYIYVPCLNQNKYYTKEQNEQYLRQLNSADKILCISEKYYKGCMLERNRALVNGADVCVAYITRQTGGTAYTVNYAEKNGVEVIRL